MNATYRGSSIHSRNGLKFAMTMAQPTVAHTKKHSMAVKRAPTPNKGRLASGSATKPAAKGPEYFLDISKLVTNPFRHKPVNPFQGVNSFEGYKREETLKSPSFNQGVTPNIFLSPENPKEKYMKTMDISSTIMNRIHQRKSQQKVQPFPLNHHSSKAEVEPFNTSPEKPVHSITCSGFDDSFSARAGTPDPSSRKENNPKNMEALLQIITELSGQIKGMKRAMNHMQLSISERDAQITELKMSLGDERQKAVQVNEHDSILLYRQQNEKNVKRVKELLGEIELLKKQLADANFQKEQELAELMQKSMDLESHNNAIQEDNEKLSTELTRMEDTIKEYKIQFELLQQELELKNIELEQKASSFDSTHLVELQTRNEALQNENERLELKIQKLELEARKKHVEKSRTACEACARLKEENVRLIQMCAEWKNKYTRIEVELKNTEKEEAERIQDTKAQLLIKEEEENAKVIELTEENEKLKKEVRKFRQELAEVTSKGKHVAAEGPSPEHKTKMKHLENENRQLKQKYETAAGKVADLEQQLEAVMNNQAEADPELAENYTKLAEEYRRLQVENETLAKKCEQVNENIEIHSELAVKDKEIEKLKKEVEKLDKLKDSLLQKTTDLQVRYSNDTMALHKEKEELARRLQQFSGKA